jgi:hypothetical protein
MTGNVTTEGAGLRRRPIKMRLCTYQTRRRGLGGGSGREGKPGLLTRPLTTDEDAAPEPAVLALAGFRRDEALWPRRELRRDRVRDFVLRYRESGPTALPPLLVATVLRQGYLVDGWLRCAAAEALGWSSLPAIGIALARQEDVYLEALAQATAGEQPLELTQVEKRAAVDRVLALELDYSERCIARLTGTTHPFVAKRKALREAGEAARAGGARLPASRREGGKILAAVARLVQMEGTLRLCTDGAALDPAAALREAAQARGEAAETLLDRLERWVVKARRDLAGDHDDEGT